MFFFATNYPKYDLILYHSVCASCGCPTPITRLLIVYFTRESFRTNLYLNIVPLVFSLLSFAVPCLAQHCHGPAHLPLN